MSDLYAQSLTQNPREIELAVGDYLTARSSFNHDDLDPTGIDLVVHQRARLLDLAVAINRASTSATGPELTRNLVSGDFPLALADGLSKPLMSGFTEAAREHEAVLWDQPVPNFRPVTLPTVDCGELVRGTPPDLIPLVEAASSVTGQPFTWTARLLISRATLIGDDAGLIAGTMEALGAAGAAVESQQIAAVLEANDNLGDGFPLFTGANALSGDLDVSGLNSMFSALRTQTTPAGRKANLPPAVLLVAPDEIASAQTLNEAMGQPVRVISNADLASGTRYIFAPLSLSRCLVRLRLMRSNPWPQVARRQPPTYDGIGVEVIHDVGIVAANRIGVVRLAS